MLLGTVSLIALIAFVAPEWAAPANTFFLIVLTVVTARLKRKADSIHKDVNSAAAAALAAAEAAAHAAETSRHTARISMELGGKLRNRTALTE